MNPFSGFLQPQNSRPLEGLATTQDLLRVGQNNKEMAQRKLENEQQNTRANSYLAMQQGDQAHRWNAEEQKQIEGLLAEYQDAEDQGDPVRLSRAAQMLKRFGMDVSQGGAPTPNLKAATGEQLLPTLSPANQQAFTGKSSPLSPQNQREFTGIPRNPIDQAVQQELASRQALKERSAAAPQAAGDQDLSQEDWEQQLIAQGEANPLPERMESTEGGKGNAGTTAEGREYLRRTMPQAPADEPVDMGDVNSPEFKQAARGEGETTRLSPEQEAAFQAWAQKNGIKDANDPRSHYDYRGFFIQSDGAPHRPGDHFPDTFKQHGHETFSEESVYSQGTGDGGRWEGEKFIPSGEQPTQSPPRGLPTQLLPTVVSKNGKQLYESTGPSGRWGPMVSGVFEPFLQNENPEIASAAKRAQQMSAKLIEVDGVAPKDAIQMGVDYLKSEAARLTGLERTKIGSKPRGGGPGGTGLMGKTQDIAESAQIYDDNARAEAAKIQEEDRQYESIEAAANSSNPALQRDAVNQLLKIRSGTAVTAAEDARISQINGLIAQVQDRLGRWTGGNMTPEMARTIQQIVALKRQVSQAKIKRIYDHQAEIYEAQNRGKTKDPAVLQERAKVIRKGGMPAGEASEEELY